MTILQRENILGLIGSRRYHSAILTTFSFDFYFFEMKAMKWLRSCGVRNVNVLMDGHYYSELMKQSSGEEMHLTPGYSLYPIFQKSIFHPKIWMLFGEKEGLLLVGSGNLTNAGNGNNEEIWGAFHFDMRLSENLQVFSASWSYLQHLCLPIKGLTKEKSTRWIMDYTKWLSELPPIGPLQFHEVNGGEKLAFLSNTDESTIWQQLSSMISKEKVIEITVLSPYYDLQGKAIQAVVSLFPLAKINVVIDDSGSVPEALPISNAYTFYNWYDVGISKVLHSKSEDSNANSKLHAKIVHFRAASSKEYCLFGSANFTPEGLGMLGATPNSEVSLLIQSDDGNLLERLGIKLKLPSMLSEFKAKNKTTVYESIIRQNNHKIKLLSAEWLHDELHLYIDGLYDSPITAKLFDRENRLLQKIKVGECEDEIKVKASALFEGTHHVELYDTESDVSLSNKILLANYSLLLRTHPNPKTGDFEEIYNQLQSGEPNKILDMLQYALLDDTESVSTTAFLTNKASQAVKSDEKVGPGKFYDLSSYKVIENNSIEKGLLLLSLSLRVLDVLKFIRTKEFAAVSEAELRVDEQESDLSTISGVEETGIEIQGNISITNLKSERRKLLSYFDNLNKHQQRLVYYTKNPENYRLSLTDLTRYLIALELILEFGGKTVKYVDNGKEQFFSYLDFNGEEPYYNDSVKGCCLNIIGVFLMLVRYGIKIYDFDYTRSKVEQLKCESLTTSIVCLLNTRWKDDEKPYLNTLLLNCLHYLSNKTPLGFDQQLPAMYQSIADKIASLKHQSNMLGENQNWFRTRVVPAFRRTIIQLETKLFDTEAISGQIIYKSPWGYCFVKDVSKQKDLTLIRPGFLWDKDLFDFRRQNKDKIYHPMRLPSFIKVIL